MPEAVFRALAGSEGERLLALPDPLRRAVLRQFELHAGRRVAEDLARLLGASWWQALPDDDRVRAVRIVAHVSARAASAPREHRQPCARTILEGTLDSILPPQGCFGLRFEPLPLAPGMVVAGRREAPCTVVLNRWLVTPREGTRLGQDDPFEERVGLATLVHEVNHLHHPTPMGPTDEAFHDEYGAWWVDFVAHVGRRPRRAEALARCQELLTSPAYADLGRALRSGSAHGERILAMLRGLGPIERPDDVAAMRCDDPLGDAPLPRAPRNLSNAPPAAPRAAAIDEPA